MATPLIKPDREKKLATATALTEQFGASAPDAVDREAYVPPVLGGVNPFPDEEQQTERSVLWEGYGVWDAIKDNYAGESLIFSALTAAQESGFAVDPNYTLPSFDSPEWQAMTDGIPEEFHDVYRKAVSADHAQFLRNKVLEELDRESRLNEYTNLGGRLALGLTNPEQLALAAMTGGTGWIAKAPTAGKAFMRAGALNAAASAATEIPIIAASETRGAEEVAYTALGGFVLGGITGPLSRYLTLKEQDELVRLGTLEEAAIRSEIDAFGADTGGAARVNPDTLGTTLRDEARLDPVVNEVPTTAYSGARVGPLRDDAAILHDIDDSALRASVGVYTGDPVGSSTGAVVPIGAAEEAHTIRKTMQNSYGLQYESAYKDWAKENGYSLWDRYSRDIRKEFGEAVTFHRTGIRVSDSPAVQRMAAYEDKFYDEFRKMARDAEVKGFSGLEGPPQGKAYRPRVYDRARVSEYATTNRFGTGTIEKLFARAFLSANPDAGEEIAMKVGKGILKKLREAHAGMNEAVIGLKEADSEWLRNLIREINDDGSLDDAEEYITRMFALKKDKTEGSVSYAKHRTVLDESATITAVDRQTGEAREVSFSELLVNDAQQLADTYAHRMSGVVGFARRAGVKSKADHEALKTQVLSHYEAVGNLEKGKEVVDAMERIYKLTHGQSLVGPGEPPYMTQMRTMARSLRDFTYATKMNMAWMANLSDSAALLVGAQAKRWFRYMPELGSLFKRMQDGTLDHGLAAEMERHTGLAMEEAVNQVFSSFDEDFATMGSKIAHGIRVTGKGTQHISMLGKLQNLNQRLYGISYATRLVDNALGKSSDLSDIRLASAGLDRPMLDRIADQVRTHGTVQELADGVKIERLNTDDWADRAAAEAYWGAVARETRRAVQEEVHGEAPGWMNTSWGKVVAQFRRFGLVAHTKQLLYSVRHRDAEVAQRLALSFVIGSITYSSQMYLYSLTKTPEEAQKWRDRYLSPGAIAWGAFSRAGLFAMTPAMWQTMQEFATQSTMTQARVSGLSGNFITGIPAVDIVMRSYKFLSEVSASALRGDKQFDQKDFKNLKGLLPYQNAPFIHQTLEWMGQQLPENDADTNAEEVDWFGRD